MDTFFATPEKLNIKELSSEIEIVSNNELMSGLLETISGLLAVLDEHRQVVAINDSFLHMLGISNPEEVLGLRLGETLNCVHAKKEPAGCGTTKYCASCGAAIAIVSSLEQNKPTEQICAIQVKKNKKLVDLVLHVKAHPVDVNNKRFLLIFLQDITEQQQRAALERTFYHDVNNMLSMLLGASELLAMKSPSKLANNIHKASIRLHKEISIQRCLSQSKSKDYKPSKNEIKIKQIFDDLKSFFENHTVSKNKTIEFQEDLPDLSIVSDLALLSRVLCNMILNALEASGVNDVVKVWFEHKKNDISFFVWNAQEISPNMQNRVFQRNYSTKGQDGRGIGTYSMKLFGEEFLGGKVSFTTSKENGTIFKFTQPI